MSPAVRALVARMLWAGMPPNLVADRTGETLPDVRAVARELKR